MSKKSRPAKAAKSEKVVKYVRSALLKDLIAKVNTTRIAVYFLPSKSQVYFKDADTIYKFSIKASELVGVFESLSQNTVVAFEVNDATFDLRYLTRKAQLDAHFLPETLVDEVRGNAGKTPAKRGEAIYRTDEQLSNDPEGHTKMLSEEAITMERIKSNILADTENQRQQFISEEQSLKGLLKNSGHDVSQISDISTFVRNLILQDPNVRRYILEQVAAAKSNADGSEVTGAEASSTEQKLSEAKERMVAEAEEALIDNMPVPELLKMSLPCRLLILLVQIQYLCQGSKALKRSQSRIVKF